MIRLGLCCIFRQAPIRFRRTTAAWLSRRSRVVAQQHLADLCRHNAAALGQALQYCRDYGIGCFRITSAILPLKSHPVFGYDIQDLPSHTEIVAAFQRCGRFARRHGIRTTFHPDQFTVLSSPRAAVVRSSIAQLEYLAEVAEWVGADVITLHGGGGYGNRPAALQRLTSCIPGLPHPVRTRLAMENDDRIYPPREILTVCAKTGVPFVYDVHHHRCLPDGAGVEETTCAARATWKREPLVHLSSPRDPGAHGRALTRHHDYIDPADFPECWRELDITVEVEAKAKELAIGRLRQWLLRTQAGCVRSPVVQRQAQGR